MSPSAETKRGVLAVFSSRTERFTVLSLPSIPLTYNLLCTYSHVAAASDGVAGVVCVRGFCCAFVVAPRGFRNVFFYCKTRYLVDMLLSFRRVALTARAGSSETS